MIGSTPVCARTSSIHARTPATTALADTPSSVSTSRMGGKSFGASVPILDTK